jgi:hypothetical protein
MVHSHERFGISENARGSIYTSDLALAKTQEKAFTRAICHWGKRKKQHLHERFVIGENARDSIYTSDLSLAKIHEQHLHERFVIGENTRDSDCKWTCLGRERAKSIVYICYFMYKK